MIGSDFYNRETAMVCISLPLSHARAEDMLCYWLCERARERECAV